MQSKLKKQETDISHFYIVLGKESFQDFVPYGETNSNTNMQSLSVANLLLVDNNRLEDMVGTKYEGDHSPTTMYKWFISISYFFSFHSISLQFSASSVSIASLYKAFAVFCFISFDCISLQSLCWSHHIRWYLAWSVGTSIHFSFSKT